eukprot:6457923-Amphidinium_carterae.1
MAHNCVCTIPCTVFAHSAGYRQCTATIAVWLKRQLHKDALHNEGSSSPTLVNRHSFAHVTIVSTFRKFSA